MHGKVVDMTYLNNFERTFCSQSWWYQGFYIGHLVLVDELQDPLIYMLVVCYLESFDLKLCTQVDDLICL